MDNAVISVKFNGNIISHWQTVDFSQSVDDLCSKVSLQLSKQGTLPAPAIDENTVIELYVSDSQIATMRIDKFSRDVSKDKSSYTLEARSMGRELVDCTYSKSLNNHKLEDIVKTLCNTFKIPLKVLCKTENVKKFALQCEPPSNAILNAARTGNVLIYPTPIGGLVITEPDNSAPICTLTEGVELLSFKIVDEYSLRFSDYTVKAYDHDEDKAINAATKDEAITYFRPRQLVADKTGHSQGACARRAEFERNRRKARAHRVEVDVYGWRYLDDNKDFNAWPINKQVRVNIPSEGINKVLLIGDVKLNIDPECGKITTLTLMSREAFIGAGNE